MAVAGFFEITESSSVHAFKTDKYVRGYTFKPMLEDRNCTNVVGLHVQLRTTFLPLS